MKPEGKDGWRLIVDLQEQKPLVRRGGMVLWLTKADDAPKQPLAQATPAADGPRIELASFGGAGGITSLPELLPVAPPLADIVTEAMLPSTGMFR
jgi:hypothetical protein